METLAARYPNVSFHKETMVFGNPSDFAIEAYHEPETNEMSWVFGKMCCWCQGKMLGDIQEPACMLDVTVGHLESTIKKLDQLTNSEVDGLSDVDAYNFLDEKMYGDSDISSEEVMYNAEHFYQFNFLTNGSESFDNSKSFVFTKNSSVRILFYDYN